MTTQVTVGSIADFEQALAGRAKNFTIVPPKGMSVAQFIPELVVFGTTLPHLKGFDAYEIEAIIRSKASLH